MFCKARTGEVSLSLLLSRSLFQLPSSVFFSEPSNPFPFTAHVTWDYGHIHHWMFLSQKDTHSCWRQILSSDFPWFACWDSRFCCSRFGAAWWDTPEAVMLRDGNFPFVIITVRNRPSDPCVLDLNNSRIAIKKAVSALILLSLRGPLWVSRLDR